MHALRFAAVAALVWLLPLAPVSHLRISGTAFAKPDGHTFDWRGITAFRLVEFVAHDKARRADAYLAWAASKKLTLVRVLTMADNLFKLSPADGQRALPRLLAMAQRHGIYVEVVALADTSSISVDVARHVKAIGEICTRYPNAVIEIANEPTHPTQVRTLHEASYVKSLAALIPADIPVSLGSVDSGEGYAQGSYVTWHAPRSTHDWPAQIAQAAALVRRYGKPVVNDEPMGAADTAIPGRRDNVPERFHEAAVASRRAGVSATFHYEGGLQARLPTATETKCLDSWLAGLEKGR